MLDLGFESQTGHGCVFLGFVVGFKAICSLFIYMNLQAEDLFLHFYMSVAVSGALCAVKCITCSHIVSIFISMNRHVVSSVLYLSVI
jgi:hypothetical protein